MISGIYKLRKFFLAVTKEKKYHNKSKQQLSKKIESCCFKISAFPSKKLFFSEQKRTERSIKEQMQTEKRVSDFKAVCSIYVVKWGIFGSFLAKKVALIQ